MFVLERMCALLRWIFHLFILQIFQLAFVSATENGKKAEGRANVLFIAIDDLRPLLGCYGDKVAITPNIDRLARGGTVFRRAYCQQAVCGPSRLSLMTGRRPDTIRVWDLKTHFRQAIPNVVTLPQHFKSHGYKTRSIGKIYHGSGISSRDEPSWTQAAMYAEVRDPKLRYASVENLKGRKGLKRSAVESAQVKDSAYIDGIVCNESLKAIRELSGEGTPFFLADLFYLRPFLALLVPLVCRLFFYFSYRILEGKHFYR